VLWAHIGCDTLAFLSMKGTMHAIDRAGGYCNACFTGRDPPPLEDIPNKQAFEGVFDSTARHANPLAHKLYRCALPSSAPAGANMLRRPNVDAQRPQSAEFICLFGDPET
jgi:hypothetical protein